MRGAAVIVTRTPLMIIAVGVRVGHTLLVRRDFPVLVGMGRVGRG